MTTAEAICLTTCPDCGANVFMPLNGVRLDVAHEPNGIFQLGFLGPTVIAYGGGVPNDRPRYMPHKHQEPES